MKTDANVSVGADTTVFSSKMQEVIGTTQKTLEKIGQAWLGFKGIAAAVQSVAQAFSAFTKPAAELEHVATSMGVLMGNAEEADKLARALRNVAVNGVVSFDELHQAARPLANIFSDSATIAQWVTAFADISAATKLPAQRLAEMVARLDDMGRAEFTELANAGVPIFGALADVLGVTTEEVVKLGREGKITRDQLLEAFQSMTAEGGKFHGINAALSNTTAGSWDTLRASVESCMAELGKPINDSLRPLMQDMSSYLQANQDKLAGFAKAVAPALQGLAIAAGGLARLLMQLASNAVVVKLGMIALSIAMSKHVVGAAVKVRASIASMMTSLATYRASMVTTGSMWAGMWTTMVAVARAAAVRIKAQLISTGVGILIWGVAEGLAWLYTKFNEEEEAAGDAAQSGEELAKSLKRQQNEAAEAAAATARLTEQERAHAEALRETEQRIKEVTELEANRVKAARKKEIAAMKSPREQLAALYSDAGYGPMGRSKANVLAEMERIRGYGELTTADDVARYKELAALLDAIAEVEEKATEAAKERAKVEADARKNYEARRLEYQRNQAEREHERKSIVEQEQALSTTGAELGVAGELNAESIRRRLNELAADGAKKNEEEIAALERLLHAWDKLVERKAGYEKMQGRRYQELQADALEAAGQTVAAARLREQLELTKRAEELQNAGATKRQAMQQATLEMQGAKAKEMAAALQSARVEFVQGHLANQGGGGVSHRLGDASLQNARKQTDLLKDLKNLLGKVKDNTARNAGGGIAVMA